MGIRCQQMNAQAIPDGCNALVNAIYQNPIYCKGPINIGDQVLELQDASPRDTQLDHLIYYTVDSWR